MPRRIGFPWFVVLFFLSSPASAEYGAFEGQVSYVYRELFFLQQGVHYTFETNYLPMGSDPVMYLWQPGVGQVAYNDDYPGLGLGSHIEFTPTETNVYMLLVRSYSNLDRGSCEIHFQGQLHGTTYFGGWKQGSSSIAGDVYETVHLLGGATDTLVHVFQASDARLIGFSDDEGVGLAARFVKPEASTTFVVASAFYLSQHTLLARLLINDKPMDQDGDGLGPTLETSLCTCDNKTSYFWCVPRGILINCANVPGTARDTDTDGLDDDKEVIGIDDATFPQKLVEWGAEPLRKDVFVELDWETQPLQGPTPETALEVAALFDEPGTAASLQNPDGSAGVKVHLDIGVACTDPQNPNCKIYGDWGGATYVEPGPSYLDPPLSHFDQVRRGTFHRGLLRAKGGQGLLHGPYFAAAWDSAASIAHELGHNLDLEHHGSAASGRANCKPHYRSLMNYAYQNQDGMRFSKKDQPWSDLALDPTNLCEANGLNTSTAGPISFLTGPPFGYALEQGDLDGNGKIGVDWTRDGHITAPPCYTGYQRAAVNYSPYGASCEWTRYRHDRVAIAPKYFTGMDVQTPAITHVYSPAYGVDKMLYAFRQSEHVHLSSSSDDFNDPQLSCWPDIAEGCHSWSSPVQLSSSCSRVNTQTGPAMEWIQWPGGPRVLVVWNVPAAWSCGNPADKLYYVLHNPVSGSVVQSGWVPGSDDVTDEPSLASYEVNTDAYNPDASGILLTFRKSDGYLWQARLPSGQSWRTAVDSRWPGGGKIAVKSSPSLARAWEDPYDAFSWTETRAVLVDNNNTLFWVHWNWSSPERRTWWPLTGMPAHKTAKKVGFAWVPNYPGSGAGRYFIMWRDQHQDPDWNKIVRSDFTRGSGDYEPGSEVFENAGLADNWWLRTEGGVTLYLNRSIDHNLRMALVFPITKELTGTEVQFRPFADGRWPVQMKDSDDFAVMKTGACAALKGCVSDCGPEPCPGSTASGELPSAPKEVMCAP